MTGIELEEVHAVLVACFDAPSFAFFLKTRMEKVLANIAGPGPFRNVVFEVLSVAEQEGWDALLVARAAEVRPQRPDIQALAKKYGANLFGQFRKHTDNAFVREAYREFGLAPRGFPTEAELGTLEKLVDPGNVMLNMPVWLARGLASQSPVCKVEIDEQAVGTGFLVGPNAVLTNHHVAAPVINQPSRLSRMALRFDYLRDRKGVIHSGTLVGVRSILEHSPPTDGELGGTPEQNDPRGDQLDYALLSTEGEPGNEPVRLPGAVDGPRRGWIRVPDASDPAAFEADQPVLIAQHSLGEPLSLAIEWKSMLGPNSTATRVKHRTNTDAGSSGSPTFDRNWNLIALHHYGDAKYGHKPRFNQGVPIAAIRQRIEERGHAGVLGGDIP